MIFMKKNKIMISLNKTIQTIIESAILNDSYRIYDGDGVEYRTLNKINIGDIVYIINLDNYAICVDSDNYDLTFAKIENDEIITFKY